MIQFSWEDLKNYTGGSWYNPHSSRFNDCGISGISTDTRRFPEKNMFLALSGETFDGHNFISNAIDSGASAVCIEKNTDAIKKIIDEKDIPCLIVNNTLTACQNLAKAHRSRFNKLVVIAVTGSSGKTTAKEILGHIIRHCTDGPVLTSFRNTNNQIGVPQNLLKLNKDHRYLVIELGTNTPGEIKILTEIVMPDISIITNTGPVHLEKLGDIEGVTKEKTAILSSSKNTQSAIIPYPLAGNHHVKSLTKTLSIVTFGGEVEADYKLNYIHETLDRSEFEIIEREKPIAVSISWNLSGVHLALNTCIAFAVGNFLNLDKQNIARALASFSMPGMRMDVKYIRDLCIINDAYNANPDSMTAFISWLKSLISTHQLKGTVYLILGDMLELGDCEAQYHKRILEQVSKELTGVKTLLVGPRMQNASKSFNFLTFDSIQALSQYLLPNLEHSDTVALKGSRGMKLELIIDHINSI